MISIKNFIMMLGILVVILAFAFVGIYPYIQIHNSSLAEKLDVCYKIAQVIVEQEETKTEKNGIEKKTTAVNKLVRQADRLNAPLDKSLASGLIQHAYNENKKTN